MSSNWCASNSRHELQLCVIISVFKSGVILTSKEPNIFRMLFSIKNQEGDPQFEILTMPKWGHPTAFEIES